MAKVEEPSAIYYSRPQILALKKRPKNAPMPCCYTEEELDVVIRESEKSGVVDNEEIKAFFSKWENL